MALVLIFPNEAVAQTFDSLHNRTLYEIAKQTSGFDDSYDNSYIPIGDRPVAMVPNEETDTIYVLNRASNTTRGGVVNGSVSVISTENNTKIGSDIPVREGPVAIAVYEQKLYVVNSGSDSVSVISTENNTKIRDIPVGQNRPVAIAFNDDTVYVVNEGSDSVSMISAENNTLVGEEIEVENDPAAIAVDHIEDENNYESANTIYVLNTRADIPPGAEELDNIGSISVIAEDNTKIGPDIPVGEGPADLAVSEDTDTVYVLNQRSNSVSVISTENNTRIAEDIPVGNFPTAIMIGATNKTYVVNSGSDSVSVISTENNTKIADIPVGQGPVDIGINYSIEDAIYVANEGSDSVSIIDDTVNRVVAGITFQVNPFNSGYIECDGLSSPLGQHIYLYSGAECIAKPVKGFEFVSWEENLGGNSTQLVQASPSASTWDSVANFFGIELVEPQAKLNITRFGNFTANFKELPPPVSSEYLVPLYGIIITTIVGWSIPSIIGWTKSKADIRKLNYYHKRIASLYGDGKLDENDIGSLNRLRSNILDAYSKGKINEKHYESLRNELSILYEKIFRKKIESSLSNKSVIKNNPQDQLIRLRNEVEYAYSEGKINEMHFNLLNKAIPNLNQ